LTTTYVCPSAGTYTIAPLTTTVSESTIWVYPTPTSYPAGTYTQSETVVTVTETDFVFFCPFATSAPAPAPPATTYAPAPAPTSAAPVSASPSSSSSSSGSGNGGTIGATSGNQWAITYTPYTAQGTCKDQGSVNNDIESIRDRGFSAVRVYSTDCSTLEWVGSACATYNLKMILGVFISDTGCSGAQEQVDTITAWAQWNLVELIVVGNEAIMNGYASAGELASFVSSAAGEFKNAGYTGQITTTEPLDIWQANTGTLCGVVDVVGCNIHPFFNPNTAASDAGSFVAGQLEIVDGLCSGKTGINLETGWPSNGDGCNGAACPGAWEQVTAVSGIISSAGSRSVMFSFENDPWKGAGDFGCEPYWGSIDLFDVLAEFANIDIPIKE
jgi:exo-beta-1,3-glucanase (GH17 family)